MAVTLFAASMLGGLRLAHGSDPTKAGLKTLRYRILRTVDRRVRRVG